MHPLRRDCRRRGWTTSCHCRNRCFETPEKSEAYRSIYGDFETPQEANTNEVSQAVRECQKEVWRTRAKLEGVGL